MKIVVTNPTGNIGRRMLRELLAPEFSVRVIARDPARLPEEIRTQVEVVRGASDDPMTLRRALDGAESLFWCVPTDSRPETDARGHCGRFARAACQAIRETSVPRVVTISACGKRLAQNAGPLSGLRAMENTLDESGASIRHLRCGLFMENLVWDAPRVRERGILSFPIPGHIPLPMVAVTDVIDVALRWLVRRDWNGIEGVAVHGPEELSCHQAAAVLERVLERPVRYREAPPNHFVQMLVGRGAGAEHARSLVEMCFEFAQGIARAEPRTPRSVTPTTLGAWARSHLLPKLESLPQQSEEGHYRCKV